MRLGAVIRWAVGLVRRPRPADMACAGTARALPPRTMPGRRWRPALDYDNGCPCANCAWARAHPMEERAPRRLPLTPAQLEQRRIHEAYLAADLAVWHSLVWMPEIRAERMKALSLALRAVRADVLAGRQALLTPLHRRPHYHGPPLASCLDHVTAAARTGPPAGRAVACLASGGALA
jgi:hypothetical protein